GIVPRVPLRGSVGSSGDLCPLAHLFVVLLGEGDYYVARTADDLKSHPRTIRRGLLDLADDLAYAGASAPWPLPGVSFKEGLALTNGATFSAALLALAVHDGEAAADCADLAAALSLEAVCGCARALDPRSMRCAAIAARSRAPSACAPCSPEAGCSKGQGPSRTFTRSAARHRCMARRATLSPMPGRSPSRRSTPRPTIRCSSPKPRTTPGIGSSAAIGPR